MSHSGLMCKNTISTIVSLRVLCSPRLLKNAHEKAFLWTQDFHSVRGHRVDLFVHKTGHLRVRLERPDRPPVFRDPLSLEIDHNRVSCVRVSLIDFIPTVLRHNLTTGTRYRTLVTSF